MKSSYLTLALLATLGSTAALTAQAAPGATFNAVARHGADDANGGVDPKPHKRHGADDANGGVDPKPHKRFDSTILARHGADDANGGVDPKPHKRHGADDANGGVDPKPHKRLSNDWDRPEPMPLSKRQA